jgi:F-type H+-transporting ATPase subunit gamma
MESLQTIKSRIKGVQNINQITKAMELVAATKMRKSQEVALASRAYAYTALDFLANLSKMEGIKMPALLKKRKVAKTAFVVVSSDKGLAGSFNSNVFRHFENYLKKENIFIGTESLKRDSVPTENVFIAFGQKAAAYLQRKGANVEKSFVKIGDFTKLEEAKPLSDFLCNNFIEKKWDKVLVFSQQFRSALKQDVLMRQVLPVDAEIIHSTIKELVPETGRFSELRGLNDSASPDPSSVEKGRRLEMTDYLIEPSPSKVLKELAPHLVEMQIYHLILEANASEHAARRMAMKNASDNAEELAGNLTLEYNKSRQAAITREIIEIVAGAEAAK